MAGATEPKPLTLDELKIEGAQHSSYLSPTAAPDAAATAKTPEPSLGTFHKEIEPILKEHCVQCHGPDEEKGDLRVDTLNPDLLEGADVDFWIDIADVLGNGEMPPPKKSKLSERDRTRAIEWLTDEIRMASMMRRATEGHSSFRRMTRYEYNHALQDLLGLPWNFARDLPPEAHSEDGFLNSSETLQMSVSQLETYRQLAWKALSRATVRGPRPAVFYWGVSMERAAGIEWGMQDTEIKQLRSKLKDDPEQSKREEARLLASFKQPPQGTYFKDLTSGRTAAHTWKYPGAKYAFKPTESRPEVPQSFDQVAILPQGPNRTLTVELGDQIPDEGILRVRVLASRVSAEDDRIPSLQLDFGWQASNEGRSRMRVSSEDIPVTAAPGHPEFYQWDVTLGDIYPRNSVRKTAKLGSTPSPSEYIRLVNSSVSGGDIQIDYVEAATPVYEQWPPESHARIFFDSANRNDEPAYAKEILTAFMSRAWRRPVTADEVERKARLFQTMRSSCDTFEDAMLEVLATVLSAPDFLYLAREDGEKQLSEHELATRLSMFLWCSVPDENLLRLANEGSLSQPAVLTDEIGRMLADPRSRRFSEQFVHQWLDMQLLDFLKPGGSFSAPLKEAMLREPVELFQEMLDHDESILNFIHSDYAMLNERLARHYGVPGVLGNHFRRVDLKHSSRRGGLLTQAGLLAMNSSGEDSNPLKRGIWMLKSLLNDPPPPPPAAVPRIDLADPRIAQMTLKERLMDHRNQPACMSCHSKIDPWGIAFENYDALGLWRDRIKGKPVDAESLLFNNEPLNGMDGLKRFLLKNRQDQFVRAVVHKTVTYALGRPLTFADRASVDAISAKVRQEGDGLATLITNVATSEIFQSK